MPELRSELRFGGLARRFNLSISAAASKIDRWKRYFVRAVHFCEGCTRAPDQPTRRPAIMQPFLSFVWNFFNLFLPDNGTGVLSENFPSSSLSELVFNFWWYYNYRTFPCLKLFLPFFLTMSVFNVFQACNLNRWFCKFWIDMMSVILFHRSSVRNSCAIFFCLKLISIFQLFGTFSIFLLISKLFWLQLSIFFFVNIMQISSVWSHSVLSATFSSFSLRRYQGPASAGANLCLESLSH